MQVLCPVDFNRVVFSATSTPYMNAVYPTMDPQDRKNPQIPQLFKISPIMQSTDFRTVCLVITDMAMYGRHSKSQTELVI